jgi:hypothetical protein
VRLVLVATTFVLVSAAAAQAAPPPYRFVGRPIAILQPSSSGPVSRPASG